MNARDDHLIAALQAAVPLHIIELRHATFEQRQRIAGQAATVIGSRGDILQFGGGKRGEVADVFNHLARGIAAASFAPGGITFAGVHWCPDHTVCEAAGAVELPRPRRPVVDLELPA